MVGLSREEDGGRLVSATKVAQNDLGTADNGDMEPSPSTRNTVLRGIAAVLAMLATPFAARDLYRMFRGEFDVLVAIFAVCTTLFVAMCAWFALRGDQVDVRARLKHMLIGGAILGSIGFALGFFGPIVWTPQSNQGPLLGIFITGPLGFVVGAGIGWFVPTKS
jgi:hypothetical protein